MNDPLYDCPSFISCSVNNCPLHPEYPSLSVSSFDPETKCKAQKSGRIRIANKYPGILKYGGLTVKERKREIRRENRTPEEWEILRLRAKNMLKSKDFSISSPRLGKRVRGKYSTC